MILSEYKSITTRVKKPGYSKSIKIKKKKIFQIFHVLQIHLKQILLKDAHHHDFYMRINLFRKKNTLIRFCKLGKQQSII